MLCVYANGFVTSIRNLQWTSIKRMTCACMCLRLSTVYIGIGSAKNHSFFFIFAQISRRWSIVTPLRSEYIHCTLHSLLLFDAFSVRCVLLKVDWKECTMLFYAIFRSVLPTQWRWRNGRWCERVCICVYVWIHASVRMSYWMKETETHIEWDRAVHWRCRHQRRLSCIGYEFIVVVVIFNGQKLRKAIAILIL